MAFRVTLPGGVSVEVDTVEEVAKLAGIVGAATLPGAAGGRARAVALTPERRSEIGGIAADRGRTFVAELDALAPFAAVLSPTVRRVYDLRREGKEPREIARIVGCTPGAASTTLSVARRRLELARAGTPGGAAPRARATYHCGKCGDEDHTARRHDAVVAARPATRAAANETAKQEQPVRAHDARIETIGESFDSTTETPKFAPDGEPLVRAAGSRAPRTCAACGEVGHDRRRHMGQSAGASDAPRPATAPGSTPFQDASVQAYLRTIRVHRVLSHDEQHALAARFKETGDRATFVRLVNANLRFVVSCAMSFKRERAKVMDLIQEGNIGLMHAIEKFEPARGFKLTTYAKHWIEAGIKAFILKNKRLVRMGKTQGERTCFSNLAKTRARLEAESGGAEVTNEAVAAAMHVKVRDVEQMTVRLGSSEASLDRPSGDGEGAALVDVLGSGVPAADEVLERSEMIALVRREAADLRRHLSPAKQRILDERILADEPANLSELGAALGVSRERVRQLEVKVIEAMELRLRRRRRPALARAA